MRSVITFSGSRSPEYLGWKDAVVFDFNYKDTTASIYFGVGIGGELSERAAG